jgi:hypothetical protein
MLRISRKKLYAKINKYQLEGQRVNPPAEDEHGR